MHNNDNNNNNRNKYDNDHNNDNNCSNNNSRNNQKYKKVNSSDLNDNSRVISDYRSDIEAALILPTDPTINATPTSSGSSGSSSNENGNDAK